MSKSDKRILDIILNYEVVGYIFSNAKVLYLVYKDFFYCRIIIQKKVFDFDVRLSLLLLLIKLVLVHLLAISCIISKKLLYGNFFFKKKRIFSLHYVCIYALLVQNTREKTTSKSNNSICYVNLFFFLKIYLLSLVCMYQS